MYIDELIQNMKIKPFKYLILYLKYGKNYKKKGVKIIKSSYENMIIQGVSYLSIP